jgi:hypothetical protein
LRAGESYRLDDDISTGQQNAVMLMLLLKLADFAIERDILSLSETQSCWQLISNRAMLLSYARAL